MVKKTKSRESLVMDVDEAGKALNLSRATAYTLINQGVIPSIRFGKRIVVPRRALEKLLDTASQQQAPNMQEVRNGL